jgi:DNA polymerase-3 subunit gamma/tau
VRDLREKARLAPAAADKKIYIIDEVHMLSKPAFNALLKTLEEPPEHVVFILATTDIEKCTRNDCFFGPKDSILSR